MTSHEGYATRPDHKLVFARLVKSHEGQGAFILLQINPLQQAGEDLPKKLFLRLDAQQQSFGIKLETAKAEDLKPQGAFANILRKNVPSGGLGRIWRDRTTGDVWLPIFTSSGSSIPTWYLQLAMKAPPEVRLVSEAGTALVRKSSKGTFTKIWSLDAPLLPWPPAEGFEDLTETLLAALAPKKLKDDKTQDEVSPSAPPQLESGTLLPEYQRSARDRLARRLKTLKKSLGEQERAVPSTQALELLETKAALLKAYLHLTKQGDHELTLAAEMTGMEQPLTIELDTDKSPGHNLDELFGSIKKAKKAKTIGEQRLKTTQQNLLTLSQDVEKLRLTPLSASDVETILARHGIRQNRQKTPEKKKDSDSLPYRTFTLAPGIEALVGKGATDNDELCRMVRSNDFWFHAIGVTGSHVVIPARQAKTGLTPELIRRAAILALHYSKLRDDRAGEVYVTKRQHIRKRKGMPPGLWQVDQAETLFLRYEESELRIILEGTKPS